MKRQIYLISESPRRKELLSGVLCRDFRILGHHHDEILKAGKAPLFQVKANCAGKINSIKSKPKNSFLIASDTIVVFGRHVLGKPANRSNAVDMLKMISGRTVSVISGAAVFDTKKNKLFYGHEKTVVKMRKLSMIEIKRYVRTGEPLDKAGAFGIQGKGGDLVEWIEGDLSNVIVLPLGRLLMLLRFAGIRV